MTARWCGVKRLALVTILAVGLTGCGSDNTDPRQGVVVIDESNCLFGGCYSLTKVCIGDELRIIYSDGYSDGDETKIYPASDECAA